MAKLGFYIVKKRYKRDVYQHEEVCMRFPKELHDFLRCLRNHQLDIKASERRQYNNHKVDRYTRRVDLEKPRRTLKFESAFRFIVYKCARQNVSRLEKTLKKHWQNIALRKRSPDIFYKKTSKLEI